MLQRLNVIKPLTRARFQSSCVGELEIEVYEDLTPLAHAFEHLEDRDNSSLYQRFDWLKSWTDHVSQPANIKPRFVYAKRQGQSSFILPMGLRTRGPFTIATWLGDSHTNFSMGLYEPAFLETVTQQAMRRLVDQIVSMLGSVDVLELCCQPLVWNGSSNPFSHLRYQMSHNQGFALSLLPDFASALDRQNGARKRKKHRWQHNQLKSVDGPHLRIASTRDEVNAFLDIAFDHMERRFSKAGIWNRFDDPGIQDFLREIAMLSLHQEEPVLRLYALEIDGDLRATFAGGVCAGQFSGNFITLAEDCYSRISPGELLIYLVVQDCAERGLHTIDFGRGEERYKTSWCDTTIPLFDTSIAYSRKAIAYSAYERTKWAAKRLVRNNPTLWSFAKNMRARLYGRM